MIYISVSNKVSTLCGPNGHNYVVILFQGTIIILDQNRFCHFQQRKQVLQF